MSILARELRLQIIESAGKEADMYTEKLKLIISSSNKCSLRMHIRSPTIAFVLLNFRG